MPRTALSLFGVQVLLALGLRATVHYWQTGSFGVQLGSAKTNRLECFIVAAFIGGAAVVGIVAPLLQLRGFVSPFIGVDPVLSQLGVSVFVLGLALEMCSQFSMGASWRVGVDAAQRTRLITSGPFAAIRNPIFTGMILASTGIVILVPNLTAMIGLALLVLAIELQVRFVEEPYLQQVHAQKYVGYASHAGRFVPWIGRLQHSDG